MRLGDVQEMIDSVSQSAGAGPDLKKSRRRNGSTVRLDRLPPNDPAAEQALIGTCLIESKVAVPQVIDELAGGAEAFYDLRHQTIFKAMSEMFDQGQGIDVVTLSRWLSDRQQLEQVGGMAYLAALPDMPASFLCEYIRIVREKYMLRRSIHTCTDMVGQIYENESDPERVMDLVEKEILAIRQEDRKSNVLTGKQMMRKAMDMVEDLHQRSGVLTGLSTGFSDLDKLTAGLQAGEMTVIAARPSMGKTSLAMNIAESVAVDQRTPVGVFSLEMNYESLALRLLCSRARVNLKNVREGFLAERDIPKLTGTAGKIGSSPIYVDDTSGLSIMQLRARARRMFQQYGIRLFVVDYLQLMHSTSRKAERREQEISDISSGCKNLAKELSVPVLVLSQLNREIDKEKRRPRLSDLRESGAIEQDADGVWMLYRPQCKDDDDQFNEQDAVPVNLLIAKQRNGPTGDVSLTFLKSYTRFESAAKVSSEDVDDRQRDLGERSLHND